ncbi:MAG TPA: histidinol-phosphate transaminase [Burkholderiales bacterium]|nr:histidinol-phosphate transaminase [Burkholderiales bacterium]
MADPQDIIRADVRAMTAYPVADARGMIKLDAMENPYALPEALRRELAQVLSECAINRYPDPTAPALKQRLREVMGLKPEWEVLLGNGSDEIIQIMVQCCARPGAVVMAPTPAFVMYKVYSLIAGAEFVGVPLRPDFSLDTERMLAELRARRPAIVFIAYPNNPTGNLYSEQDIIAIAEAAPGLVVIDEAYQPFAGNSLIGLLDRYRHVVLLRTVSKLGLAGLRLGYAVGHPEWVREFDKVRSPYNVNVLTQAAAEWILRRHELLDAQAASIRAGREALFKAMAALPGVQPFPSAANFILGRVPDAPRLVAGLAQRRVLIKSLHGAHPLLEQCIRVTVGTEAENAAFLDALRAGLAELHGGLSPMARP